MICLFNSYTIQPIHVITRHYNRYTLPKTALNPTIIDIPHLIAPVIQLPFLYISCLELKYISKYLYENLSTLRPLSNMPTLDQKEFKRG